MSRQRKLDGSAFAHFKKAAESISVRVHCWRLRYVNGRIFLLKNVMRSADCSRSFQYFSMKQTLNEIYPFLMFYKIFEVVENHIVFDSYGFITKIKQRCLILYFHIDLINFKIKL